MPPLRPMIRPDGPSRPTEVRVPSGRMNLASPRWADAAETMIKAEAEGKYDGDRAVPLTRWLSDSFTKQT